MCRWLLFCILPHLTFCFGILNSDLNSLAKLLMYFEMLIVPHTLHCVDSCIFVFTSFDTVWHTVLVSVPGPPPPPPPPLPKIFFIRFSFFVKIHLLESSQLPPPPPPPFPQIFLSDLVLAPSSLYQPPPDKGHTVREYY